jgi:serine/threonine protein kinase
MKEKGYCHSDIKPANTQLVKCEDRDDAYILKVIDFGGVTKDSLEYSAHTPAFFNSPNRY